MKNKILYRIDRLKFFWILRQCRQDLDRSFRSAYKHYKRESRILPRDFNEEFN